MQSDATFLLIMPSYNQAHYIASAVESVLTQDDPNWVLWIVDNSSDTTPEVMKQFIDSRVHFVHISQRMDPGTCLNWVLEREGHRHRDFSYIHTDNLLRADYIRSMRSALSVAENCIAYCDMRTLNAQGQLTGVFRRGTFDLARLFSLSPLGVPFSATTCLARALGGFNQRDVADDVVFCLRAWPLSQFVYIPDAIMDYRLHDSSRTESHGGAMEINRSFLDTYHRLLSEMSQRGVDPVQALYSRLQRLQSDIEMALEDIWYRERELTALMTQAPSLQTFVDLQLIDLPQHAPSGDARQNSSTETGWLRLKGKVRKRLRRWIKQGSSNQDSTQAALHARVSRHSVWALSVQLCDHAVPWLYLSIKQLGGQPEFLRITSTDICTLWITYVLHRMCGWRFKVAPTLAMDATKWPHIDVSPENADAKQTLISLAPGQVQVRIGNGDDTRHPC